ncbi:metalloregulator ArsR/SmtB family transcription factor [Haliea sp. E17]|uniref:metalloregulator ArsR/SmtB family transcription factor n=1 Tax=Haliea sp. E17 TaxID=3401576 RepID=UPI003AAE2474
MLTPVQLLKCLADETRLHATLLIFQQGELCVCELVAALGEGQSKISRHLAQLRNCGVLADTRRGQWVFYSIARDVPDWALAILRTAGEASVGELAVYRDNLDRMAGRPACC